MLKLRERLLSDSEHFDDLFVLVGVNAFQIIDKAFSLADKLEKTESGMMVFFVNFKMIAQLRNSCR